MRAIFSSLVLIGAMPFKPMLATPASTPRPEPATAPSRHFSARAERPFASTLEYQS